MKSYYISFNTLFCCAVALRLQGDLQRSHPYVGDSEIACFMQYMLHVGMLK